MNLENEILENKIVVLSPNDPFTWSSGIKSPIYCDNRQILAFPELRTFVAKELLSKINKNYSECEVVMGTSTAGIPHATLVASFGDLPCGYVRDSNKKHGKGNQIEGASVEGKKVVVVEDLISTGGSVIKVVEALRAAGADVIGVVAIFSYNMPISDVQFRELKISYQTLTNIDKLISELGTKFSLDDIKMVKNFLDNPQGDWQK